MTVEHILLLGGEVHHESIAAGETKLIAEVAEETVMPYGTVKVERVVLTVVESNIAKEDGIVQQGHGIAEMIACTEHIDADGSIPGIGLALHPRLGADAIHMHPAEAATAHLSEDGLRPIADKAEVDGVGVDVEVPALYGRVHHTFHGSHGVAPLGDRSHDVNSLPLAVQAGRGMGITQQRVVERSLVHQYFGLEHRAAEQSVGRSLARHGSAEDHTLLDVGIFQQIIQHYFRKTDMYRVGLTRTGQSVGKDEMPLVADAESVHLQRRIGCGIDEVAVADGPYRVGQHNRGRQQMYIH